MSLERASVEAGAVVTLIDIKAVQDSPVKPEKQEADEIESTPISPVRNDNNNLVVVHSSLSRMRFIRKKILLKLSQRQTSPLPLHQV